MRAIIYAMEQTKSFDTKKAAEYLKNMKKPLPGITGPIAFAADGNRLGGTYVTFKIQKNGKFAVDYIQK